jgi:long-subunit fatty acid transport protein
MWINSSATEIIDAQLTTRNSSLVPDTLRIPGVHNDGWNFIVRVVGKVKERWKLGLSIEYDMKTVPEAYMTPSNLDFDNISFNLGAQVRLWRKLYLGASFSQFIVVPRTIEKSAFENSNVEPYSFPDPTGVYSGNAERLGLDLTARF